MSNEKAKQPLERKGNLMQGKRGLIMGLANKNSIAWGITKALFEQGAEMAFSYQGEALKKRVVPLAESVDSKITLPCDVSEQSSIDNLFSSLKKEWGSLDFVVHAIAYSDKNELTGGYVDTSIENFTNTLNVSCYSFTSVAREAAKMMQDGGSMITLTYAGSERVMPHYNVMGVAKAALETSVKYLAADLGGKNIRVNSISAGPIKTLAASGIGDFRYILRWNELNSPLKRNVSIDEVGGTAVYLLSDLGSGTTGENIHTDSGYHIVGMKAIDAPDISVE